MKLEMFGMTSIVANTQPCKTNASQSSGRTQTVAYFLLAVLGFSFWFFMAVPFATHRESYGWLAGVQTESFVQQFAFGESSTYRPLAQVVTWLGFRILHPAVFPTSVLRQALLQGTVYAFFVLAWWLIYSAAPQRRLFAICACIIGGIFFSGYVHLFHIYGMFYVPVILMLGALLYLDSAGTFDRYERLLAITALILVFWHPFATALFLGFYFGFCVDTFGRRNRWQHIQAIAILAAGIVAIGLFVIIFPRAKMPFDEKLIGFLVSYKTNEINRVTSFVALLMAEITILSMHLSRRVKLIGVFVVFALSSIFIVKSIPVLLIWICVGLLKLFRLRHWSLFFLMLTAALLPFGGGIGSPMYALFAITLAAYMAALGWSSVESALSVLKPQYVIGMITVAALVVLMVRTGINVPIITRAATPLLVERERTYQLENILAWLHKSDYCGYQIAFVDDAGSPIDDVESAVTRRNRPPAALHDVQFFWNTVLRCQKGNRSNDEVATVTFGASTLGESMPVFTTEGKYAGDAIVWIKRR